MCAFTPWLCQRDEFCTEHLWVCEGILDLNLSNISLSNTINHSRWKYEPCVQSSEQRRGAGGSWQARGELRGVGLGASLTRCLAGIHEEESVTLITVNLAGISFGCSRATANVLSPGWSHLREESHGDSLCAGPSAVLACPKGPGGPPHASAAL